MKIASSSRGAVAAAVALSMLAGCATIVGRPTVPLNAKRETPGVVLCQSERNSGGIRLIGHLDPGIYPITKVTLQYRIAEPQDAVPAVNAGGRLDLTSPRAEKVSYRKGANEVVFNIDAEQARNLRGKVLWYRWLVEYDRGGLSVDATDIHRTSLEEAGHPRAAFEPGPDTAVAPAVTRRR